MAKVVAGMVMSLDGFVQDREGSVARLYPDFAAMRESEALQEAIATTGAVVMGRRSYEMAQGDFTGYEFQVPIFVVTHSAPGRVAKGENGRLSFTFVTDGIASAINRAQAAAGEQDVTIIGGANTIQQCLNAGLVDELRVDVCPVLLGAGLRLFEHLAVQRIHLEQISAQAGPVTIDLRFRVVK
jgi:dihydrofolate reductase